MGQQVIDIPGVGAVEFPESMSDEEVSRAAAKLYAGAQPSYLDSHPKTKQLVRGTLDAIPAVGGMAGGALGTLGEPGLGTMAGGALGFGAGQGLRDLIAQGIGLENTSPTEKAFNIGAATAVAGATEGLIGLAGQPLRNAKILGKAALEAAPEGIRRGARILGQLLPEGVTAERAVLSRPAWQTMDRTLPYEGPIPRLAGKAPTLEESLSKAIEDVRTAPEAPRVVSARPDVTLTEAGAPAVREFEPGTGQSRTVVTRKPVTATSPRLVKKEATNLGTELQSMLEDIRSGTPPSKVTGAPGVTQTVTGKPSVSEAVYDELTKPRTVSVTPQSSGLPASFEKFTPGPSADALHSALSNPVFNSNPQWAETAKQARDLLKSDPDALLKYPEVRVKLNEFIKETLFAAKKAKGN